MAPARGATTMTRLRCLAKAYHSSGRACPCHGSAMICPRGSARETKIMLFNLLEYHWAEDIDDALLLLARTDIKTVPLAGGTYLLGLENDSIQAVVDLRDLGLAYISEDAQGIHIGAMTTLLTMGDSPLLKDFATGIVSRAAYASSFSRLIR